MTDATGTTSPPGFALGEHESVYRQAVDRNDTVIARLGEDRDISLERVIWR